MAQVNYNKYVTRILDILKKNKKLAGMVSEFRFGDMGDNKDKLINANSYPLIYVTTAASPEVLRQDIHPQGNVNKLPTQKIILEFWVIIIASGADAEATQHELYQITNQVTHILARNQQLRNTAGHDNLCSVAEIFTQKRHETYRGKLVEAMTVRIRPTTFVSY